MKEEVEELRSEVPVKKEVEEVLVKKEVEERRSEVNDQLASLGLGPAVERHGLRKRCAEIGKMQGKHGFKGAEYGRLGGRPAGKEKAASLSEPTKRLRGSPKKRDESFGWHARIEVAELVDKVLEVCSKRKWCLDDVYTYLSQQLSRPKAKVKWAHENVEMWRKYVKEAQLGKCNKNTLRMRGKSESYNATFTTSKGLRAPGGGSKSQFKELYPAVKLFFVLERANGRYVDREDLVVLVELNDTNSKMSAVIFVMGSCPCL